MGSGTSLGIIVCCTIFILVTLGIMIAFIIVGSVWTASYVNSRQSKKIDSKTQCLLLSKSGSTQTCTLPGENPSSYTCYIEKFDVTYVIFNGTKITSKITTQGSVIRPNLEVGKSYPCYYDQSNVLIVTWEPYIPTVNGLVPMIVGWSGTFVCLVAVSIGIFVLCVICCIRSN